MFVFHCHKCGQSFKLFLENLAQKQSIICPNCEQNLDALAHKHLQTIGSSYMVLIDHLKLIMREGSGWSISIAEYDEQRPGLKCCVSDVVINREDIRRESYWGRPVTKEYHARKSLNKNQNT